MQGVYLGGDVREPCKQGSETGKGETQQRGQYGEGCCWGNGMVRELISSRDLLENSTHLSSTPLVGRAAGVF